MDRFPSTIRNRGRAVLALSVAALVAPMPLLAGDADPGPERQRELLHLLKHDCGSCHGLSLKGGLGPALTPDALAGRPPEAMVQTLLHGRPGTPMPPWSPMLSADEARWLMERLYAGETDGSP